MDNLMNSWTIDDLDLEDEINQDIWTKSLEIQQQVRVAHPTDRADVLQGRLEGGLPWVPDLCGKDWRGEDTVFVVGSAYSPFVGDSAGRSRTMDAGDYRRAKSAGDFQRAFLNTVVTNDPSYYGPLAILLQPVVGSLTKVLVTDLVRACFVKTDDLSGGDGAVAADPELFMTYARSNWDWTWQRLREGSATTIVAVGSIAERGLLQLLISEGLTLWIDDRQVQLKDAPVTDYASRMHLGDWRHQQTWWEIGGRVDGQDRVWKMLPVVHPSRVSKYDSGYEESRAVLAKMMGQPNPATLPTSATMRPSSIARTSPTTISGPRSTSRSRVIGMHFVCRNDRNLVDQGRGRFETGFWKVARRHCDTVEYIALHNSKEEPSYRQGQVVSWRTAIYQGATRVVFTVEDNGERRSWVGSGTGEKGYAWE